MDGLAGNRPGLPIAGAPHTGAQPAGEMGNGGEQLARQFHQSPIGWNAHAPTTTTTTTTAATTTTSTTVTGATAETAPSNASSNSSAHTREETVLERRQLLVGQLKEVVSEKALYGDECFRALYGEHMSLLDNEGRPAVGFLLDPNQCPPRLQRAAQGLAVCMQTRNSCVSDLKEAWVALEAAEAELARMQASGETGADVDAATKVRDNAKEWCANEEGALKDIQKGLEQLHREAAQLMKPRGKALGAKRVQPPVAEVRRREELVATARSIGRGIAVFAIGTGLLGIGIYLAENYHNALVAELHAEANRAFVNYIEAGDAHEFLAKYPAPLNLDREYDDSVNKGAVASIARRGLYAANENTPFMQSAAQFMDSAIQFVMAVVCVAFGCLMVILHMF